MRWSVLLVLVGCALLTGCSGVDSAPTTAATPEAATTAATAVADHSTGTRETTSATTGRPTTSPPEPDDVAISNATAKERALRAEAERVRTILDSLNSSNYSDLARPFDDEAEVLARDEAGVRVEVLASYGYGYHCGSEAGFVDGYTETVYLVTENETRLVDESEGVTGVCD